jgi:dextranase
MPVSEEDRRGAGLHDLRAFYRTGEDIQLSSLPAGTAQVLARVARGDVVEAERGSGALFRRIGAGTYAVEARGPDGRLLAEEFTTVGAHAGERPVHGFATSFVPEAVPAVLDWLKALRCTVVQIYDWMASYAAPLGPPEGWKDPSNREVSFYALQDLAAGIRANGAVAHAYAPVYALDIPFAADHPDMLMYRNDGGPQQFFNFIQLADPANVNWQHHFAAGYGSAADAIGFDGFHVDTYGYPRAPLDRDGTPIDMRTAYESFLVHLRAARPVDQISFNQVNGVPSAVKLSGEPVFRYCEVWPPNDRWRHLEGLLDRSAGRAGLLENRAPTEELMRGTIACYPPVWGTGSPTGPVQGPARQDALRTVTLTEAIATCLGASALLYGDASAVLCDPYYPKHERLSVAEATTALVWRRFALRCRDLFLEGEDTSWYDIGDENGAVALDWDGGTVSPEPGGGAVFARVVRTPDCVAVGLVDLTGSANGSWSERTPAGRCRSVRARVLLDGLDNWKADAAVLGRAGGRFAPLPFEVVGHRQGLAAEIVVPVDDGWSVLRMRRGL